MHASVFLDKEIALHYSYFVFLGGIAAFVLSRPEGLPNAACSPG